jgi:hypothetical protein
MIKKVLNIFLIFLFILLGCKDKSTTPKDELPLGYQKDINWPSLADSPWPMNHHDPQSTGRCKFSGPENENVEWEIEANNLQTGVSIGYENTIYFGTLKAINERGDMKWFYNMSALSAMTPLVTSDSAIIMGSSDTLYSIGYNGIIKWKYKTDGILFAPLLNIGADKTIYIIDSQKQLYALDENGNLKWNLTDNRFNTAGFGTAFSPDGNFLYCPGEGVSVLAIDVHNKIVVWTFGVKSMRNSPVVDSDGNIYLLPWYAEPNKSEVQFYSIKPNGSIRWSFDFYHSTNASYNSNTPTIDLYGNIYFSDDSLYSINYYGVLNWKIPLKGFNDCPLVCDLNGNIYVGSMGIDPFITNIAITCYTMDGQLKWQILLNQDQVGGSPALGKNADLYFPSWRSNKLYKIK